MPIINPDIVTLTELGNRFRVHSDYKQETLIRDLRDMLEGINERFLQLEEIAEDHETRLIGGGL